MTIDDPGSRALLLAYARSEAPDELTTRRVWRRIARTLEGEAELPAREARLHGTRGA